MADSLRIAKERRDALGVELVRLDNFIRMAEALDQTSRSRLPALCNLTSSPAPTARGVLAVAHESLCDAPKQRHVGLDRRVAAEASRLLLPHYADDACPIEKNEGVTGTSIARVAGSSSPPSNYGNYIGALRTGGRRHFAKSQNLPALLAKPGSSSVNFIMAVRRLWRAATIPGFGRPAFVKAVRDEIRRHFGRVQNTPGFFLPRAEPNLRDLADEAVSASPSHKSRASSAGIHSAVGREAATHRADAVIPSDAQASSMRRVAADLERLRTRAQAVVHSLDMHLGQRIRQRRWMLGMSRKQLGQRIGATREQIESYETGSDQIDVTRLYNIAAALEVPVAFFFEGLEVQAPDTADVRAELLSDQEALKLLGAFSDDTIFFSSSRSA